MGVSCQRLIAKNGRQEAGFTLAELLVYVAIFSIAAALFVGILFTVLNTQNKEQAGAEVSQQLNLVLNTVQRLVAGSSLVEAVYEDGNPSSPCVTFCTLKLRRSDPTKDPTFISSDANGVYLKEGSNATTTITTSKVAVDFLKFIRYEIAGGHAVVEVNASLSYNTQNPKLAIKKTLKSAIARVSAATFDSDLLPNTDNLYDIGQITSNLRWRNGRFSGDLTVAGNVGIGTTGPASKLEVSGGGIKVSNTGVSTLGIDAGRNLEIHGSSTIAYIDLANDIATDFDWRIYSDTGASPGLIIRSAASTTPVMRFSYDGKVGIGTTAAGAKLGVYNDTTQNDIAIKATNVSGTIQFVPNLGSGGYNPISQSGDQGIIFYGSSSSTGNLVIAPWSSTLSGIRITSSGNVGIGTATPGAKLEVNGALKITDGTQGSGKVLTSDASGLASWQTPAGGVPVGTILPYASSTAPSGWLLADGSAVSRSTYSDLYNLIGTTYGAGDGSTTFNLPDLRGRVAVGKGTNTEVDVLGESENVAVGLRTPRHYHQVYRYYNTCCSVAHGTGNGGLEGYSDLINIDAGASTHTLQLAGPVELDPANKRPKDTPAYLVINYIIKY